jgi:hypothetical protein
MNSAQLREALEATHDEFNDMADNFDAIMKEAQIYNAQLQTNHQTQNNDEEKADNNDNKPSSPDNKPPNALSTYDTTDDTDMNDVDNKTPSSGHKQSSLQKAVQDENKKHQEMKQSHPAQTGNTTNPNHKTNAKRITGELRTNLHMEFMQVEFKKIKDRTTLRQTALGLLIAMLTTNNRLKFYDAYGDPVTLKDLEDMSEDDYDKRLKTNEALN